MRKKSLFNQYLFSFLLIISLMVLMVAVMMFSLYSQLQISSARSYSISQLEQVCRMTSLLHDEMISISNQILQSSVTNTCLSSDSFNRLKEAKAAIKLREIQTSYPYVRYVSFYNCASNRFVSSSTAGFLTQEDVEYYYRTHTDDLLGICALRLIGPDYATQPTKTKYVYSFIIPIRVRNTGDPDLAIIDVDSDFFSQAIDSLRGGGGFQQIMIMNRDNEIFSINTAYDDGETFSLTQSPALAKEDFPELTDSSGAFSHRLSDGTRVLVTYAKTSDSFFTVVNVVPYSNILGALPQIATLTVLSCLLVLLVGTFVAYRTSAWLSRPIEILYRRYVKNSGSERSGNELEQLNQAVAMTYARADQLDQGLITSYAESKKRFIQRLLHGEIGSEQKDIDACREFDIDLLSPYYCIVAIRCVPKDDAPEQSDSESFILHYSLENIAAEVLGQYGKIASYLSSKNILTILLPLPSEEYPDGIQSELERIISAMDELFSIETTICIGRTVASASNINMCYVSTHFALEYAPLSASETVFFAGEALHSERMDGYHNDLHLRLAGLIRQGDTEACERELDQTFSYMADYSFATAVSYFNHVMMSLLDDFSSVISASDTYSMLMDKLNQIDSSLPNVYMLRQRCTEFVTLLTHVLGINRRHGNAQIIQSATVYLEKNYSNPDLSLRMLAEMSDLSPAYFGKLFTAQTTYSFTDYLNNLRMDHAAQMLLTTKETVTQISQAVGILNTNYFYNLFKKRFGMTPVAYRRSKGKMESA